MLRRLWLVGMLVVGASLCGGAAQGAPPSFQSFIVVLKPGADRASVVANAHSHGGDVYAEYGSALNGFAVRLPEPAIQGIVSNPNVLFATPDREVVQAAVSSPVCQIFGDVAEFPGQCIPPGIDRTDADRSSTTSGDGRGSVSVNVAVLDTGVDAQHPDLNVIGGTTCINDALPATSDPDYHGTFVAGVIGARDNDFGVVGVVPGARLWSARVLKKNGIGTTSTLICGIDWVTSTRTDSDPTNDIAVANMSIGGLVRNADDGNCGLTNKDALHLAICNSVAAGVSYVVSAGNESKDLRDYAPAAYDEVLTATAMGDFDGQPGGLFAQTCQSNSDDTPASFSNFATLAGDQTHTLAAPGVCVISTYATTFDPPYLYARSSGTSFASPLIAGVVALCISSGPCAGLTPAQIIQKIVGDAAAYNRAAKNTGYGFQGDPLRPISGKYYGYLIRAGMY